MPGYLKLLETKIKQSQAKMQSPVRTLAAGLTDYGCIYTPDPETTKPVRFAEFYSRGFQQTECQRVKPGNGFA